MQIKSGELKGKSLGFVSASYVGSRVFYKDFFNSIRNFFGWELKSYTDLVEESRDIVLKKMISKAESIGGNGIGNLRFETTFITSNSISIMGYGDVIRV